MTRRSEISLAVIDALAAAEHRAPQELSYSLHEFVDTAALAALAEMEQTGWELSFEVPDHRVTVDGDGRVFVDGDLVRTAEYARQRGLH